MAGDLALAHAGEARLRAALAAAASAPVAPAWDTIRSRVLDDDESLGAPLHRTATPIPSRRAALLAAAAVLLVIVAGVVVASRPDDAPTQRAGTVGPSGWFVPVDLPEGWSVTAVTAVRSDGPRCPEPGEEPVRGVRWVRPADGATVVVVAGSSGCGATDTDLGPEGADVHRPETTDEDPVDLGSDAGQGWLSRALEGDEARLVWQVGRAYWVFESDGVAPEDLVALGREVVVAGSFDVAPAGFTVADRWSEPAQPHTVVEVEVTSADGTRLAYLVAPPGTGLFRGRPDARPLRLPGQDLELQALGFPTSPWTALYGLAAPEVDITLFARTTTVDGYVEGSSLATPVRPEILAAAEDLATALAPATTEQWRDLLAAADEHTPVLDEAASFAALEALDVSPRPPLPTIPGTTTGTIIASSSTTTAPP